MFDTEKTTFVLDGGHQFCVAQDFRHTTQSVDKKTCSTIGNCLLVCAHILCTLTNVPLIFFHYLKQNENVGSFINGPYVLSVG